MIVQWVGVFALHMVNLGLIAHTPYISPEPARNKPWALLGVTPKKNKRIIYYLTSHSMFPEREHSSYIFLSRHIM